MRVPRGVVLVKFVDMVIRSRMRYELGSFRAGGCDHNFCGEMLARRSLECFRKSGGHGIINPVELSRKVLMTLHKEQRLTVSTKTIVSTKAR